MSMLNSLMSLKVLLLLLLALSLPFLFVLSAVFPSMIDTQSVVICSSTSSPPQSSSSASPLGARVHNLLAQWFPFFHAQLRAGNPPAAKHITLWRTLSWPYHFLPSSRSIKLQIDLAELVTFFLVLQSQYNWLNSSPSYFSCFFLDIFWYTLKQIFGQL